MTLNFTFSSDFTGIALSGAINGTEEEIRFAIETGISEKICDNLQKRFAGINENATNEILVRADHDVEPNYEPKETAPIGFKAPKATK